MSQVRYQMRIAEDAEDIRAAQHLRHVAFKAALDDGLDCDSYDAACRHVVVEDSCRARLVATCRVLPLASGAEVDQSYSAQFYDLTGLSGYYGPISELGRFCTAEDARDPDILRALWGGVAQIVEETGSRMLFGCSSFKGTDASAYSDTFSMLCEDHLAPRHWRPKVKAPKVFRFAKRSRRVQDRAEALRRMPPMLRSYLSLGGRVSDHAVVDAELNTLHVFTGLEISAIPAARARSLRDLGGIGK